MMVGMSVNMEGIQFLLLLGPGNSFATFFPKVVVLCVSGSRDLLGGSKPSTAPTVTVGILFQSWTLFKIQETGFYRWGN